MSVEMQAIAAASLKALVVLSFLVLIVGLIKPKWIFFWMKAPDRVLVSIIALLILMGSFTGYTMVVGVKERPKVKTERERTREEINDLNLGPSGLQR
jgi:hypothetical protein